jgi:hypothetical protein
MLLASPSSCAKLRREPVRTTLAIQLCVALLLSLAEAPFFHVHEEHVDHHQGPVAHTHQSAHRPDKQAGFNSHDEDSGAKELNWFQLEQRTPRTLPMVLAASCSFEPPQVIAISVHRERPRNHGPPLPVSLHPRAPPA